MLFRKPIGETMRVFRFNLVKIIPLKSNNCALALRKRLFCDAKQPLLACKTYAFVMQNNRFCNALMHSVLCNSFACEKYLHLCRFLFAHEER